MNQALNQRKLPPVVARIEKLDDGGCPICVLVVGMAGSGKTTLMAQLQESTMEYENDDEGGDEEPEEEACEKKQDTIEENNNDAGVGQEDEQQDVNANANVGVAAEAEEDHSKPSATPPSQEETSSERKNESGKNSSNPMEPASMPAYCINLDPATLDVPYAPSIDIRDTVDYKQVMTQHNLGPNGAIMTSLNLYATKFDQVIHILENRTDNGQMSPYLLVDTPGQIEAFTWSASGQILSESLASTFPTVLVFVIDTVRCANAPNTFMSNMLYACSMYYRTRLPLVICFNKTDVVSHDFCMEWMKDYESFQEALDVAREESSSGGSFYDSLTRSLSLVLDEFYHSFAKNAVGVSAVTGDGIDNFWNVIHEAARVDFAVDYIQDLKYRIQEQEAKEKALARLSVKRFQRDSDHE